MKKKNIEVTKSQNALCSDTLPKVRKLICQVKIFIFAREKCFGTFMNELSDMKLFSCPMVIYFSQHACSTYKLWVLAYSSRGPELRARCPNLGHTTLYQLVQDLTQAKQIYCRLKFVIVSQHCIAISIIPLLEIYRNSKDKGYVKHT